MGETPHDEAQIYQWRAVLRGISPLIWRRRLLVRSDSTVAELQQTLQVAFGWDDEHLNRFESRGREYAVYRDGGRRSMKFTIQVLIEFPDALPLTVPIQALDRTISITTRLASLTTGSGIGAESAFRPVSLNRRSTSSLPSGL
jgi:Plasmid pRiA4b ORF-3-like protein